MKNMPAGPDNFEFTLIENFAGYDSSIDPTKKVKTSDGILVRGSVNMYKKLSGTVSVRPGLKRYDPADTTEAGTKTSWDWNTWDARILEMRINNNKLQVLSDIVNSGSPIWYTLLSSLPTSFDKAVFDAYWDNTNKKDVLLFVGGTHDLYHWSGAMALFVSATATVLTLDRDAAVAGFSTSGSIILSDGTTATYSGISGSTLTGMSVNLSSEPVNTVVLEQTGSNSNTPASTFTNDFIKVHTNQLYVGSYTSRQAYLSKNTSYTDFSFGTPRLPGEGDILTLDDTLKGFGVRNGNVWIGAGTSEWYEITFNQITVGSVLTEQTKVDKKPVSALSAPLGHEFIDNIGDELICLTQDHQVRRIGQFANVFVTKYPTLSLAVKTEFEEEDFTGGHLKCVGDFIYITAPINGRDYMHETRETIDIQGNILTEKFWHPPQIRNISRFALIDGVIYGHSNANPQMYKIWDTDQWYDDSPSGDQLPYNCVLLLMYQNGGRRQGKISFDKLFTEGYATPNSQIYAGVYYNYQGSGGFLNPPINIIGYPFAKTFSGLVPPSLGNDSLGENPLGDGLNLLADDQALVPKWKQITGLAQIDCYEFALMLYSQSANSRWEVLALGTNMKLSGFSATDIIKK